MVTTGVGDFGRAMSISLDDAMAATFFADGEAAPPLFALPSLEGAPLLPVDDLGHDSRV